MKIHWTIDSILELQPLTPERRREVWRGCSSKALRHWRSWLGLAIAGVCGGAGACAGGKLGIAVTGEIRSALIGFPLFLLACALGGGLGGDIGRWG